MQVSLSWLKDYIPIKKIDAEILADKLTMAGLEVEGLWDRYQHLKQVLVARIISVQEHPQADRLKICRVACGDQEKLVVCGAPNAAPDLVTALALPGACLADNTIIQKSKIRGVLSEGMLCSEEDLGLGTNTAGLLVLNSDLKIGTPLAIALGLEDQVLEIDLTPNRPDCLSIIGVAREIAGFDYGKLKYPLITLSQEGEQIKTMTSVEIENPQACHRYAARLIENVKVGPSPAWMQARLLSIGLKPINNIVDCTNFVMLEYGQPLHAFDFDQLAENRIVVRMAGQGEKFITLDQKERTLHADTLMICDGQKPIAIGGVMGGLNSEIKKTTTRVLIESACFAPGSIRKTSKKLDLSTDASHRFERGVDPDGTVRALDRVAELMLTTAEADLVPGLIDEHPKPQSSLSLELSTTKTNCILGTDLKQAEIKKLLEAIEFQVKTINTDLLSVQAPSFRVDVTRSIDLIEEVARLWGYNKIAVTFPLIPAHGRLINQRIDWREHIRSLMIGFGFTETINYSFIDQNACDHIGLPNDDPRRQVATLLNPLSVSQRIMRSTLLPGMLGTLGRNLTLSSGLTLKIFEVGKIFIQGSAEQPLEKEMLLALWCSPKQTCDFFDIKGVAQGLLKALGIDAGYTKLSQQDCYYTRPGYTAQIIIDSKILGLVGEINPTLMKTYHLNQTAYLLELDLELLYQLIPLGKLERQVKPLPKFPSVTRDITMIIDREIEAAEIVNSIISNVSQNKDQSLVEDVYIIDVYEGDKTPAKKSISLRIIFRSGEKTLEDEVVNALHTEIAERVIKQFKADLP